MAKKKSSTTHSKKPQPPSEPTPQLPSESAVAMDDSSEQLNLLKAFNDKLIKQTAAGRDLIEGLEREKKSLAAQLAQAQTTEAGLVESLQAEKSELLRNLEMEKEKLARAREEKESWMSELASMKEGWRLAGEEAEKLRVRCEGLVLEREAGEEAIKRLESDNRSIATELKDLDFVVDGLKAKNNRSLKEKSELEARIGALENKLGAESEVASRLRADLNALLMKNSEMERFVADKVGEKEADIVRLRNANTEKEKLVENLEFRLTEAVTRWKRSLSEADGKIEELVREKLQVEEARVSLEAETIRLSNEVSELRDALFESRNSCRDEEGKNEKLISEFESLKKAFERAMKESQTTQKALEAEQSNAEFLKRALSEKETLVEERTRELFASKAEIKNRDSEIAVLKDEVCKLGKSLLAEEQGNSKMVSELGRLEAALKRETDALLEERKTVEVMKSSVSEKEKIAKEMVKELNSLKEENKRVAKKAALLAKERDSANEKLVEAEKRSQQWSEESESAKGNFERAMTVLKKMVTGEEEKLTEESSPYFSELEAIQKAFREKEKAVEAMKAQVEALKQSTAEANRKKSFWTLVSSATTLFAAASVAYAAKGQR